MHATNNPAMKRMFAAVREKLSAHKKGGAAA